MERETIKKGNALIKEIDELKAYKLMQANKQYSLGNHFEYVMNYRDDSERIIIRNRHNPRFIKILEEIIAELEQELKDLQ